ncbi:MAG: FxLYD domain-containing protein [Planctomycetales bacterium]|jgi:hypothetical protein
MNESMKSGILTKTCSTCFSEIDARAGKCPQCHALQGPLKILLIAGVTLVVASVVGSAIWLDIFVHQKFRSDGPDFSANIEVVDSRLFFVPNEDSHRVSVVGLLKNSGRSRVNRIKLELRLTDQTGNLIDTIKQTTNDDLLPDDEVSFKISTYRNIHSPQSDYAHHDVIIRSAKYR